MSSFEFASPWFLLGIPVVVLLSLWLSRRSKRYAINFSSTSLARPLKANIFKRLM